MNYIKMILSFTSTILGGHNHYKQRKPAFILWNTKSREKEEHLNYKKETPFYPYNFQVYNCQRS